MPLIDTARKLLYVFNLFSNLSSVLVWFDEFNERRIGSMIWVMFRHSFVINKENLSIYVVSNSIIIDDYPLLENRRQIESIIKQRGKHELYFRRLNNKYQLQKTNHTSYIYLCSGQEEVDYYQSSLYFQCQPSTCSSI